MAQAAQQHVVAEPAHQDVVAQPGEHDVVASTTVDGVGTVTAAIVSSPASPEM